MGCPCSKKKQYTEKELELIEKMKSTTEPKPETTHIKVEGNDGVYFVSKT